MAGDEFQAAWVPIPEGDYGFSDFHPDPIPDLYAYLNDPHRKCSNPNCKRCLENQRLYGAKVSAAEVRKKASRVALDGIPQSVWDEALEKLWENIGPYDEYEHDPNPEVTAAEDFKTAVAIILEGQKKGGN